MRCDVTPCEDFALKWFTWGYRRDGRTREALYCVLRIPGLHWVYNVCTDSWCWMSMAIFWDQPQGFGPFGRFGIRYVPVLTPELV